MEKCITHYVPYPAWMTCQSLQFILTTQIKLITVNSNINAPCVLQCDLQLHTAILFRAAAWLLATWKARRLTPWLAYVANCCSMLPHAIYYQWRTSDVLIAEPRAHDGRRVCCCIGVVKHCSNDPMCSRSVKTEGARLCIFHCILNCIVTIKYRQKIFFYWVY